jgi:hypothetical protein
MAETLPTEDVPILVRARLVEYMAGDSCVNIQVGSNGLTQKFWVPTKDIVGYPPPKTE